jgi:hypothetical protein
MDTGADTVVYPCSKIRGHTNKSDYELFAANETRIATYGSVTVSLNLSLRRAFRWRFIVADVQVAYHQCRFLKPLRVARRPT